MQKWQFYAVVGDNGYGLADDWRQASAFLDNLDKAEMVCYFQKRIKFEQ